MQRVRVQSLTAGSSGRLLEEGRAATAILLEEGRAAAAIQRAIRPRLAERKAKGALAI